MSEFTVPILLPEATPDNPPIGYQYVYGKGDGNLYSLNSNGDEYRLTDTGTPIGNIEINRFGEVPPKYLALDGNTYNVDDFPVLGLKYGGVPGGTFQVDDYRNLPIWGAGTNPAGSIIGNDTRNLQHDHGGNTGNDSAGSSKFVLNILGSNTSNSPHTHSISNDLSTTTDIRPKRAHALWIIKAL